MSESSKSLINFIKLNSQELSSKIALLVSTHSRVIFWKTAPRYYEGKATNFVVTNKTQLTLNQLHLPLNLIGESICLNFIVNDIDYFLRAKVIIQDEQSMTVELFEDCFRVEKRKKERLVVFPVYDVNLYFRLKKQESPNVVFLNKSPQRNTNDFFSVIDSAQKNRNSSLLQEGILAEDEDVVGFRVEDVSSNGLSFFASANEKDIVLDNLEEEALSLVLKFEKQIFHLDEASFVYKIHYINSQFSGVPMYKIGMTFKSIASLKEKIEEISGITVDLFDYQKEFEEFIKNE